MRFVKTCVSTKVVASGALSDTVVCYGVVYNVKKCLGPRSARHLLAGRVTVAVYEVGCGTNPTCRVVEAEASDYRSQTHTIHYLRRGPTSHIAVSVIPS
jgi:hypothetical protein